jgi:FkbH-like protein
MDEYLTSLDMTGSIEPFTEEDYPRLAQLSQRSNQFNLRTVRHSVGDIAEIAADKKYLTLSVKLRDKFGDYGLISILIVELREDGTAFMNTWLMSCRVLKRGVEEYVLNYIAENLKKLGYKTLIGEYIPTAKNKLVENHYTTLGFDKESENTWTLDVEHFNARTHFINK